MDGADGRRWLITLHLAPPLGPVRIARLVNAFGSARDAARAPVCELARVSGIGPKLAVRIAVALESADAERELRLARAAGARVLTWLDTDYPVRLRALRDAPPVLYVLGAWPSAPGPAVAVVGTRRATPYGEGLAGALGEVLGAAGVTVVSGLARGIDRAAHAGTLRADGTTVGVLACGVDVAYPPEHRVLMEAMRKRGAIVSEAPMGRRPLRQAFPRRNRLISALAQAVVVVEGDVDSGALITARYAAIQGRPVFAVPGDVRAPGSRGPHRLLAEGARVLDDPSALLGALGITASGGGAAVPRPPAGPEARVLAALGERFVHVDQVVERCGLGAAQTVAALAALEVRGLARQGPGQHFARRAPWADGAGRDKPASGPAARADARHLSRNPAEGRDANGARDAGAGGD